MENLARRTETDLNLDEIGNSNPPRLYNNSTIIRSSSGSNCNAATRAYIYIYIRFLYFKYNDLVLLHKDFPGKSEEEQKLHFRITRYMENAVGPS